MGLLLPPAPPLPYWVMMVPITAIFNPSVANGACGIKEHTKPDQLHHLPGNRKSNDNYSRSLTTTELLISPRHLYGPEFIYLPKISGGRN